MSWLYLLNNNIQTYVLKVKKGNGNYEWENLIFIWRCNFMGKYLDQCAKDAWDVIKGRKKIIGNKIIECSNPTDKNIESQE